MSQGDRGFLPARPYCKSSRPQSAPNRRIGRQRAASGRVQSPAYPRVPFTSMAETIDGHDHSQRTDRQLCVPRPDYLIEAMAAHGAGRLDDAELGRVMERAVAETIAAMEITGSPIVTDGEQSKPSFAIYPLAGLGTLSPDGVVIPFEDRRAGPVARAVAGLRGAQQSADRALLRSRAWRRDGTGSPPVTSRRPERVGGCGEVRINGAHRPQVAPRHARIAFSLHDSRPPPRARPTGFDNPNGLGVPVPRGDA